MILFKKEHIQMIRTGRKTVTRRLWKKRRAVPGSIHLAKTGFRKDDAFAQIRILSVYTERLGDITREQVRREGYRNAEQYFRVIQEINKRPIDPEQIVWVVEFELVRMITT